MHVSLNWLKRYVNLDGRTPAELSHAFTMVGFEVEGVKHTGLAPMANVVVGEVLVRDPHPNADKLSVCQVQVAPGEPARQIVCGAQNYKVGDRVPVALPGAVLPGDFKIKQSKIRSVESSGMMCSARELGLGDDHGGLLILERRPEIGTPIHLALGSGDTVFDLEITPNRPDALSHIGLARELAAWFRTPLRYPEVAFSAPAADAPPAATVLQSVKVEADQACPLYTAHVIRGVKVAPSPAWLQELLQSVGLRPINNIVDITNFVLLETGQPLHAFDASRIRGGQLIVRNATPGEKLTTLDGKERVLAATHLTIRDAERPLVVAGIMGGQDAEVTDSTVDVVLEAAWFAPQPIRRTARQLGMSSDSSYRFERGCDVMGVLPAARRAVDLILSIAGGTVHGPVLHAGTPPSLEREISVSPNWIRAKAGFDISDADQRAMLESLELRLVREESRDDGSPVWTFSVPSWRADLDRQVDLLEEVVRLNGTERIPSGRVSFGSIVAEDDGTATFSAAAATALVGRSFQEAVTYTLRPSNELEGWVPAVSAAALRVANPLAEENACLRHSLLPGLLEVLRLNQARQTGATRFFETGRTFKEVNGQIHEMVSVGFAIQLPESAQTWKPREAADYHHARSTVQALARLAGIEFGATDARPVIGSNTAWQAGHSAESGSFAAGVEARYGLVNLALTRQLGIDGTVVAGVLDILPRKLQAGQDRPRFKAVSPFPAATRDLAVIVPTSSPAAEVERSLLKLARAAAGNAFAVESIRLFDVYAGQGVPEGSRSLAYSLMFRSPERTLTDDEVNAAFNRLQEEVAKAGMTVRK